MPLLPRSMTRPRRSPGAFVATRRAISGCLGSSSTLSVPEFDEDDARQAGQIRAQLASKGTPIGPYDVLIAGQAMPRELTLVTHNTSEFERVPGLKLEDWKGPAAPRQRRNDR